MTRVFTSSEVSVNGRPACRLTRRLASGAEPNRDPAVTLIVGSKRRCQWGLQILYGLASDAVMRPERLSWAGHQRADRRPGRTRRPLRAGHALLDMSTKSRRRGRPAAGSAGGLRAARTDSPGDLSHISPPVSDRLIAFSGQLSRTANAPSERLAGTGPSGGTADPSSSRATRSGAIQLHRACPVQRLLSMTIRTSGAPFPFQSIRRRPTSNRETQTSTATSIT